MDMVRIEESKREKESQELFPIWQINLGMRGKIWITTDDFGESCKLQTRLEKDAGEPVSGRGERESPIENTGGVKKTER